LEGLVIRLISKSDWWTSLLVSRVEGSLRRKSELSGGPLRFFIRVADLLADNGRFEEARGIYDDIHKSQPDQIEKYLRRYEGLGGRLFLQGRRKEGLRYWILQREIQYRLAEKNGLIPSDVAYLAPDWSWAYGHLGQIHLYIEMNLLSKNPKRVVLLAKRGAVANQPLLDHYRSYLEIDDTPETARSLPAVLLADGLTVLRSEEGQCEYISDALLRARRRWLEEGRGPLLRLSDEEMERGKGLLKQLGADPEGWFVCLHVRDAPEIGDRHSRNAKLGTYEEAVKFITQAGGQVIRIGPKLTPPSTMPHLFDYASSPLRSDWGDVFLSGACRFFLGTNSGPCLVPEAFGVPCAITNWHPFGEGPFGGLDLCKLLWHEKEKRYLTFREMLQPPFATTERQALLRQHGVTLVDNTPEDLRLLAEEMLQRLDHKMHYTKEQEEDQAAFAAIMKEDQPEFQSRLGAAFLQKHRNLLN
jgi:putative glycosyltransferase (TIGR04372 family)